MAANKALFNMQLAATHISFMLHSNPDDTVSFLLQNSFILLICYIQMIPNFPSVIKDLESSNNNGGNLFKAFITTLADEKGNLENLHLPLQVALLISPILLLQDAQIHLSQFFVQQFKLALVCFKIFITKKKKKIPVIF